MTMKSGNFSEDANFLSIPFETYNDLSIPGGEVSNLHTITLLERLELEDLETPHLLCTGKSPVRLSEAWMMRRIEPFGPVDYLEYHHRAN